MTSNARKLFNIPNTAAPVKDKTKCPWCEKRYTTIEYIEHFDISLGTMKGHYKLICEPCKVIDEVDTLEDCSCGES